MKNPKKIIILFSGGADSTLLLYWATCVMRGMTVMPVFFHYGQKHAKEADYAKKIIHQIVGKRERQRRGTGASEIRELVEIDLRGAFHHRTSNLLSTAANFPGVHPMHVPARNGTFLFTALGLAESTDIDEIWIGCDFSDRLNLFPDCYQEWVVAMDAIAQKNGSRPIRIKAPLLGLTKEDVISLLQAAGFAKEEIFSGYEDPQPQTQAVPESDSDDEEEEDDDEG